MRVHTIGLFILALLAAGPAVAGEQFDPAARAKAVAPFIDEQTVLIARVDLSQVEVDPIVDKAMELIGQVVPEALADPDKFREDGAQARAMLKKLQAAFRQAGGREVYLLFSMADVDFRREPAPLLIIPLAEGADAKALADLCKTVMDVQQRLGDVLFVGTRPTLDRLKALRPVQRPEIAAAFRAAGDSVAQAIFLPPTHAARVIEEMLPKLPEEIGDGPSTAITHGLLWAVASADPPPKMALRLVIQSRDAGAAAAFREKWTAAFQLLGKQKEVRKRVPTFDKIATLLRPKVEGDRLTLTFNEENQGVASLISLLTPPIQEARAAAMRAASTNNLKQIAIAMHNYDNVFKHFPAAASYDASGKPLLSWRVHILPFLAQGQLYKQFHLDEPWDSEHNRKLINQMPAVYRCPASKLREKGRASYVVAVGKDTVFPGREGIPLKEIKDGTSNTIMLVEVDDEHAVIWTKPDDLPFDPDKPAKGLGGHFQGGFNAAFCDGSVHFLSKGIDPKVLRALFTRAGGEPIDWQAIRAPLTQATKPTGVPKRIHPPRIDGLAAGKAAVKEYDSDHDDAISGSELDEAPSLKAAIGNLDSNRDGKITANEVARRVDAWRQSKIGIMSVVCRVTLDGQPLDGARINFEPEQFLGDEVKQASGLTGSRDGEHGLAVISLPERERPSPALPGAYCGLYRVRISRIVDGKEMIPARYNANTILGVEISVDANWVQRGLSFHLKSR